MRFLWTGDSSDAITLTSCAEECYSMWETLTPLLMHWNQSQALWQNRAPLAAHRAKRKQSTWQTTETSDSSSRRNSSYIHIACKRLCPTNSHSPGSDQRLVRTARGTSLFLREAKTCVLKGLCQWIWVCVYVCINLVWT